MMKYNYTPLSKPIPISEQQWPEGTLPIVSICCQTYNHKDFIEEALESFLMQKTDFPIEILLRDDASTDGTAEICKEYAHKYPDIINLLAYEENQWQKGVRPFIDNVKRAKGKYIAICEGDDYWTDPNKLQRQVDCLKKNKEYSGVAAKSNVFYTDTKKKHINVNHNKSTITIQDLQKGLHFQTATLLFRSELTKHFENLPILSGDKYLFLLVASYGKIHMFQDVMTVYRKHPGGLSHFVTSTQILTDVLIADKIKKHSEDFLPNEYKIHILEKVFLASSVIYFSDLIKTTKIYFRITLFNKMEHSRFWYFKHYYRLLQKGIRKIKFKRITG